MYEYHAEVVEVHDGDTVTLAVDLGFGTVRTDRFRLYGPDPGGAVGMNAPELNTPPGKAARDYLAGLIDRAGGGVTVRTVKDRREKYGRYLAVLYSGVGRENLNQLMIDAGHAVLKRYD